MVTFKDSNWQLSVNPLDIFSKLPLGSTFSNDPNLAYTKVSSSLFKSTSAPPEEFSIIEHLSFFQFIITVIPGYPRSFVTIGKQTFQGTKLRKLTYNLSKRN